MNNRKKYEVDPEPIKTPSDGPLFVMEESCS